MIPGQRAAQSPQRAAVAVQRVMGRAIAQAGEMCTQLGLTDVDSGQQLLLSVDDQGQEIWTCQATGAVTFARYDDEAERCPPCVEL